MSKKGLLDRWRSQQKKKEAITAIAKRPIGTRAPLSLGQQRLWFLQQLYPDNPFYHYADVLRLKGRLVEAHLRESFRQLAQKYAILRTTFPSDQGEAYQYIGEAAAIDFITQDIRSLAGEQREARAQAIALASASEAFDLETGPLTRVGLIRLTDNEYWLVLTMHHIITDKWSMGLLREDLAKLYEGLLAGKAVELTPLPLSYADYAYWERQQLVDPTHLAYWKKQLAGELPILKLPTDHTRMGKPSFAGAFSVQAFSTQLSAQLSQLCQQNNTTLFVLLLTAYKVLLYKYTGQKDIIVGTPFSNRDQLALQQLIGFFNDTLVLRSDLSKTPSFEQLLQEVRSMVLTAFTHKKTPFEVLVRELSPERATSANPLFQVMFLFHKVPPKPSLGPELALEHQPFDLGVSKFDLTLYISEEEGQLSAIFEYATDLFEASTIERMQEHLRVLLEAIVENPGQSIAALPILSSEEKQKILVDWNQHQLPIGETTVHQLIEAQAQQKAEEPAVVYEGEELSYQALQEKSDLIARTLQARGIGQGDIVGLYTERSLDMMVGILAILKSGGAYLPIDPEYPKDRIDFMLEDAAVKVVLCQDKVFHELSTTVDKLSLQSRKYEGNTSLPPLVPPVGNDHLAYIIYTSGSTGRPKGVQVTHKNLLHSTQARFSYYPQQPGRFLLLSSFAFDSSIVGIFWTLTQGGTIVLPKRRIEQDLDQMADLIASQQVTHTLLLPSLYRVLLQHISTEKLQSLRTLIVAGEACSTALVRQHFDALPAVELYNEYGPTEASVWCTAHKVQPEDAEGSVPIGRSIPNAEIYILDAHLAPVPIGVAGELYVGGAGITLGYLNRPDLTQEQFIPHPFSQDKAAKLYRTGDLARYREDGLIDFLGRADHQVKIRGYRIELSEIKETLVRIEGVKDALVVVQEEEGNNRLIAYTIGDTKLASTGILKAVGTQLPAYMVPAQLHILAAWPRLPNGKIDRKSLPKPEAQQTVSNDAYAAPRSSVEQTLATIWEEVLKRNPIGIHDNFFEIGGDSILSIQIIAKARKAGLAMAANQLFEHQTIAALSLFVTEAQPKTPTADEPLVGALPLSPIQEWFFEGHQLAPHHWNQGIAFDLLAELPVSLLSQAVAYLITRHDALRLRFEQEFGQWKAYYRAPETVHAFQHFDLAHVSQPEVAIQQKINEIQASFDLSAGHLFQAVYCSGNDELKPQLFLLAHHLIIDAVSWQIIFDDLKTICSQLAAEESIDLPSKTLSFRDWSQYLREKVGEGSWDKEVGFWEKQAQLGPRLKSDREGKWPTNEAQTETLSFQFSEATTATLINEVPSAYNTKTDEILLAALLLAMREETTASTLTLGLERHGREQLEEYFDFSASVGWFTAFYLLRLEIAQDAEIGTLIKSVKEQMRQVPNGGIGYGALRYLRPEKLSLGKAPDLVFNFLGQQDLLSSPIFSKGRMLFEGARDPRSERQYAMEINAFLLHNKLEIRWSYSIDFYQENTINSFMLAFEKALGQIINHCASGEIGEYTPSDFPDADLSQDDLDNLLGQIDF